MNPEMVVLAGGLVNGWELFEKHMRQQVAKRAFALPAARVPIVRAERGDDAGLLGAARLAFALWDLPGHVATLDDLRKNFSLTV